jgi:UDP-N-acetylglucosamine--N-acetylmuramyl-(pentapeptide) pyrophosphoryl-undecaprenol N-acetylglucosamine transferase
MRRDLIVTSYGQILRAASVVAPHNPWLIKYRSKWLRSRGDAGTALALIDRALLATPPDDRLLRERVRAIGELAEVRWAAGDVDGAFALIDQVLAAATQEEQLIKKCTQICAVFAKTLRTEGDDRGALGVLDRALTLFPNSEQLLRERAIALAWSGNAGRAERDENTPSYLFFCVNGAGLGHLNRALAIARRIIRLQPAANISFLTSSRMLDAISHEGFIPYYIPPFRAYGGRITAAEWNKMLYAQIREIAELHRPTTLVYDGVSPYSGLIRALKRCGFKRTAMVLRLRHTHTRLEELSHRFGLFDQIIHPGEIGDAETVLLSPIPQLQPRRVAPILYFDREEVLSRLEARQRLRLPMDRRVVYLQLGAGNINEASTWTGHALALLARLPEVKVVLAQSPIADREMAAPPGVQLIREYPSARYFNAFDLAISAGGYNTVHELLFYGVPAILIPLETVTDDQEGRARAVQRAGAAVVVRRPEELADALARLLDDEVRERLRKCAKRIIPLNGADEAAHLIAN